MPRAKKSGAPKPVAPVAPAPPPPPAVAPVVAAPSNMAVLWPKLEVHEFSTMSEKGPIDVQWAKDVMWWETEKEYQKRKVAEDPSTKPEHWLFGDGRMRDDGLGIQPIHCVNILGEKVICWNNAHNRAFDEEWCKALIQTILYGHWAGPHTIPGETVNGETIRISKYGRVLSGQHQLTALILAAEVMAKHREQGVDHPDRPKYPTWSKHGAPFIETIVVRGLSEDPRVLMTVDYVKPRTVADVFYTSDTFKSATPPDRKELCRTLAGAVDFLWTRTKALGYRTHPEVVGFLERHKKLLKCVEHLHTTNSVAGGRKIGELRLTAGRCAALMYVMASSGPGTDGDVYRNEDPPSEKNLDWSLWDLAEEFWTLLADGQDYLPLRRALRRLVPMAKVSGDRERAEADGIERIAEKLAILAKAWEVVREYPTAGDAPFTSADLEVGGALSLTYTDLDDKGNKLPEGQVKLIDVADFFGIDAAPTSTGKGTSAAREPEPPPPTKEEMERLLEETRQRRAAGAK
jgi:hypothetical protein